MDPKPILGKFIRESRIKFGMSQQVLAERVGLSYQYVSEIETGKANLTVDVLNAIAVVLSVDFPSLVWQSFRFDGHESPRVCESFFRRDVPLPPNLTCKDLITVLDETQKLVSALNTNLMRQGAGMLHSLIQGNNFSGLVSNLLTRNFDRFTSFKANSPQAYPDLIDQKTKTGLEIKTTIQIGKGGESHNGHSGWHLVACYSIAKDTGDIEFIHVMLADLRANGTKDEDWVYVGSKKNKETGSQRTETYNTNGYGTTKLRDGTVYINTTRVDSRKWRQFRRYDGLPPEWSIFRIQSPRQ